MALGLAGQASAAAIVAPVAAAAPERRRPPAVLGCGRPAPRAGPLSSSAFLRVVIGLTGPPKGLSKLMQCQWRDGGVRLEEGENWALTAYSSLPRHHPVWVWLLPGVAALRSTAFPARLRPAPSGAPPRPLTSPQITCKPRSVIASRAAAPAAPRQCDSAAPPPTMFALAPALPACLEAEEVCDSDSCAVQRSHASVSGGSLASAETGSWPRPPSRHQRNQSCPAALMHTSNSSSALVELEAMEEEPSTPPAWSPALQVRGAPGAAAGTAVLIPYARPPLPACGTASPACLTLLQAVRPRKRMPAVAVGQSRSLWVLSVLPVPEPPPPTQLS